MRWSLRWRHEVNVRIKGPQYRTGPAEYVLNVVNVKVLWAVHLPLDQAFGPRTFDPAMMGEWNR